MTADVLKALASRATNGFLPFVVDAVLLPACIRKASDLETMCVRLLQDLGILRPVD